MNYVKRLNKVKNFSTLRECLFENGKQYGDRIAYCQIADKKSEYSISFYDLLHNCIAIGTRLLSLGFHNKHIAVIGENSIEWMETYLSVVCGTGVACPLDRELNAETLKAQINHCDAEAVFFSATVAAKVVGLMKDCPKVRLWVLMRPELTEEEYPQLTTLLQLLAEGRRLVAQGDRSFLDATVDPDALCDIIYTSGTTGANKGVMLSHKNICTVVRGSLMLIVPARSSISVLPINHAYEKNCHVLCYFVIGRPVCINDDLMHMTNNIRRFNPGLSVMVPMILETLERKIHMESKKVGLDRHMDYGIKVSNILRRFGIDKREKFFKPVLSFFGTDLRQIICGGAPLREENRKFLDSIGLTIVNGYGISECGPLVAANFTGYQRAGSVGYIMPGCEVRIDDMNENGEGEILVRGDNVMMGYYKDPVSTERVMTEDGWLRTGDLGHMDSDRFLYISGRLKNLIILSNGKNISPEEIEEMAVHAIPYIKEIVVYADEAGTGIYASCYLDEDYLKEKQVTDAYQYLLNDILSFNQTVPSFKRISDVLVVGHEFDKTTTKKIQRFKVDKIYK